MRKARFLLAVIDGEGSSRRPLVSSPNSSGAAMRCTYWPIRRSERWPDRLVVLSARGGMRHTSTPDPSRRPLSPRWRAQPPARLPGAQRLCREEMTRRFAGDVVATIREFPADAVLADGLPRILIGAHRPACRPPLCLHRRT